MIRSHARWPNDYHGSVYEFFRNDSLDARNAFLAQRDPNTGRIKPVLRYNQYGGTLGGPVYLPRFGEGGPGFYNGKDKTFFYFGYEQWKFRTANINRSSVPTAAERAGDFEAPHREMASNSGYMTRDDRPILGERLSRPDPM